MLNSFQKWPFYNKYIFQSLELFWTCQTTFTVTENVIMVKKNCPKPAGTDFFWMTVIHNSLLGWNEHSWKKCLSNLPVNFNGIKTCSGKPFSHLSSWLLVKNLMTLNSFFCYLSSVMIIWPFFSPTKRPYQGCILTYGRSFSLQQNL